MLKWIDLKEFQIYPFDNGTQMIVLGCTELSIIKKEYKLDHHYLDGLELLAATILLKFNINIKNDYHYLIR